MTPSTDFSDEVKKDVEMLEGVHEDGDLEPEIQYDEAEGKKILRQVDWRLLPLLSLLYLLSFLDRGNSELIYYLP
jgi:hypothetical protein